MVAVLSISILGVLAVGILYFYLFKYTPKPVAPILQQKAKPAVREQEKVEVDLNTTQSKFDPNRGGLSSTYKNWQTEKQNKLGDSLNRQTQIEADLHAGQAKLYRAEGEVKVAQHTLEQLPAQLERVVEAEEAAHELNMAIRVNEQQVVKKATLAGHHAPTYLKTEERRQLNALERAEKDADSNRKTREHEEMQKIDVKKDYEIRMNQLKAVLALKTFPYMKLAEIRRYVRELLLEHAKVFSMDEKEFPKAAKVEYLALINKTITVYEGQYERGLRLLQTVDGGEELGGADGHAQLGSAISGVAEAPDDEV